MEIYIRGKQEQGWQDHCQVEFRRGISDGKDLVLSNSRKNRNPVCFRKSLFALGKVKYNLLS